MTPAQRCYPVQPHRVQAFIKGTYVARVHFLMPPSRRTSDDAAPQARVSDVAPFDAYIF